MPHDLAHRFIFKKVLAFDGLNRLKPAFAVAYVGLAIDLGYAVRNWIGDKGAHGLVAFLIGFCGQFLQAVHCSSLSRLAVENGADACCRHKDWQISYPR